jgi:hypothetical protein
VTWQPTALDTHVRDLRRRLEKLQELRRNLDQETAAIRQRTYRIEDDRQADLDKVTREASRRIEQTLASAQESLRFASELTHDKRVNARVDAGAQARVRELLARELAPSAILARAHELGDADTVTALRSEMLWWGDKRGFADASETIEATERALAEIAEGSSRHDARRALELRSLEEAVENVAVFALGNGSPRARIAAGYAMEEAKRAGQPLRRDE